MYQLADLSAFGIESHLLRPGAAELRLAFILAHPDDETFGNAGTILRYVRQGVGVHYVCATKGECGVAADEHLRGYADIPSMRVAELNTAAHALGLASYHLLNYRDSGMAGSEENQHPEALAAAPLEAVTERITAALRAIRPHVVVTFNAYGGYGHPDHIATHHATVRAFAAAGDPNAYPEQLTAGLAAWAPSKLYFTTFAPKLMRLGLRLMPIFGVDPRRAGENGDVDMVRIVEEVTPITTTIDCRGDLDAKEAAWRAYRSQLGSMRALFALPKALRRLYASDEHFTLIEPAPGPGLRERDLFAGIKTTAAR